MLEEEGWYMIRSMKEQGVSISEIARKLGISRTTVRIYEELKKKVSRDHIPL